jgi:hypothetical protein
MGRQLLCCGSEKSLSVVRLRPAACMSHARARTHVAYDRIVSVKCRLSAVMYS